MSPDEQQSAVHDKSSVLVLTARPLNLLLYCLNNMQNIELQKEH